MGAAPPHSPHTACPTLFSTDAPVQRSCAAAIACLAIALPHCIPQALKATCTFVPEITDAARTVYETVDQGNQDVITRYCVVTLPLPSARTQAPHAVCDEVVAKWSAESQGTGVTYQTAHNPVILARINNLGPS